MHTNLSIIGSGGHAKVVVESLNFSRSDIKVKIFDENRSTLDLLLGKYSVEFLEDWTDLDNYFHVAIGSNESRARISQDAIKFGKKPFNVIHSLATVFESVSLQEGIFLAANSIVASGSVINSGCIVNHAAIIDHDCIIGEYSHIAPNATLGGGVSVGAQCLICAGSIILPDIKIGNNVVIGAGSVVVKNVKDSQIIVGVPGKEIRKK